MLTIRMMLARENKKRDNEPHDDTYDDVWLKQTDADGSIVERRVDKVSRKPNETLPRKLTLPSLNQSTGFPRSDGLTKSGFPLRTLNYHSDVS